MAVGSGIDPLSKRDIGFAGWCGGALRGTPSETALEFLARGSLELATMEGSETEIRFLMAERLCNHLDALVVLSLFDNANRAFKVEGVFGPALQLQKATGMLPGGLIGTSFEVGDTADWSGMASPVLQTLHGGMDELSFGRIGPDICRVIEAILEVESVQVMGICQGRRIEGSIAILSRKGRPITDPMAVEAFINLGCMAIQRRRATVELRRVNELLGWKIADMGLGSARRIREMGVRLLDISPIGIVVMGPDGRAEFANPWFRNLVSIFQDELGTPQDWSLVRVLDGDSGLLERDAWPDRVALAEGRVVTGARLILEGPSGRRLYLMVSAAPIPAGAGPSERAVLTVEDATASAHSENEARVREARLRTLVEQHAELIFRFLPGGTITYTNEAFKTCFESKWSDAEGRSVWELVYPVDRLVHERKLKRLRPGRPTTVFECRVQMGDESVRWHEWTVRAIFADSKTPVEFQAVSRDITERRETEETLAYLATHDGLTDLPNRLLFADRTATALARSQRNGKCVAVALIDLDLFKEVNDAWGHSTGDALLRAIGQRLRAAVRRGDTVARMGGDEFTVVMPDLACDDLIVSLVRRIKQVFESPFPVDGTSIWLTASIGVAVHPTHGEDIDHLVRCADRAMYEVKQTGGNGIAVYDTPMIESMAQV